MSVYEQQVAWVAKVAPEHPLLSVLQQGESVINRLYLKKVVADIHAAPKDKTIGEGGKLDEVHRGDPRDDLANAPATNLHQQLRKLYKKKAKIRNGYFQCTNDTQRATIHLKLVDLRRQINDLCRRIEYYEETGELVKLPSPQTVNESLPTDAVELQKLLLNVRSNISKTRRKLNKAYKDKATKVRIIDLENRLQQYEQKRDFIHARITSSEKNNQA